MDWLDSVQNIRRLKNENRLVIIVGAGVSKNSDMPLWSELIKKIADKINYSRCTFCNNRKAKCKVYCYF